MVLFSLLSKVFFKTFNPAPYRMLRYNTGYNLGYNIIILSISLPIYLPIYLSVNNVPSWLSPQWLCSNSCTWTHDIQLHIAGTNEPKSAQQAKQGA